MVAFVVYISDSDHNICYLSGSCIMYISLLILHYDMLSNFTVQDTVVETMLKTDTLSHLCEDDDYDSFIQ